MDHLAGLPEEDQKLALGEPVRTIFRNLVYRPKGLNRGRSGATLTARILGLADMIHNRKARIAVRRADALERARQVLEAIADGSLDPYDRCIYGVYLSSGGLAEELKPFFRLPGVEPDGFLRVDDDSRSMIRRLAGEWLRGEWPPRSP